MKNTARDEIEIEPGELFGALFRHSWIILLCTVLAAVLAWLACRFVVRPVYRSSTTVYVLSRESGGAAITYSDLQTAEQLTSDYEELIKSRFVLETVLTDLDLDMPMKELKKAVTVTSPAGTRMLEIAVDDEDPYLARELANRIREVSGKRIVEIMNIDAVSLVDEADLPAEPFSPDVQMPADRGWVRVLRGACDRGRSDPAERFDPDAGGRGAVSRAQRARHHPGRPVRAHGKAGDRARLPRVGIV